MRSSRSIAPSATYQSRPSGSASACEACGRVKSAAIIKDKLRGMSRSFGFVAMPIAAEVQATIAGLMGNELLGQSMREVR